MKTFFTLLLVCFLFSANANTYYFSAISGDDSRTALQAQNPATPWKTLTKLNAHFINLLAGDSVLLKRGETFYGSIIVTKSGNSIDPIVIADYGTGNRPVVTSLVTLTGWTANSTYSGVYESAANSLLSDAVNMVVVNGKQKGIGRYPNLNSADKGYLTLETHVGSTSITDNELPSSPNWTGADVIVRTSRWTLDKSVISSHSGTKITYTATPGTYGARDLYGYFIQNNIKTLDQVGEWYYNPSTKRVSMFFGSTNPSSYSVQAATIDNLLYSTNKSYFIFNNITFKGANATGIDINGGTYNYVNNCDILFSGRDGVKASGTMFKIENSNILDANNDGVNVGNGSTSTVRNCIVKNTYTIAGMGQSGNGSGAGIRNSGKGIVEYNQIINSGYVGIQLGGDHALIKNNLVDSFSFIKDDGSGIYTYVGSSNSTRVGRKIVGNIIMNGIGAGAGTPNPLSASAEGIYLDDNSNGVEITGNTVTNCVKGLFLHNSRDVVVKDNTFYNHTAGQLYMKHDDLGDPLTNHTIVNNIFFSKHATQIISSISTKVDDIVTLGNMDSNYYARPMDDNMGIHNVTNLYGATEATNYRDLKGWNTKYGHDDHSKRSAKQIAPYKILNTLGINKLTNGNFDTKVSGFPNYCTLVWSNAGVLDGGYEKIVPSEVSSSIVIGIGALTAGKSYVLRYSLKGEGPMSLGANLRAANYSPNTPVIKRPISTTRTENEILFTPTTTETAGSIVFTADSKTTYYLDNVQLYEVEAVITNVHDSIRFEYNASTVNKTVQLSGSYVDVKNNKYLNSIVIKPYESAILIKDVEAAATPNAAPTVSITSPARDTTFASPASVVINVTAADTDGSVKKVDFYNGTTLLGSDSTSPFSFTWSNVPTGSYSLMAKATDNGSLVATSSNINFSTYTPNVAPTVSVTSPAQDTTFASPASVIINVTAADADGSVSKVDFYNDSTLLGSDSTNPFSFTWSNVPTGNYSLKAKATDNGSLVTTSSNINFSTYTPNVAPTVSITSPAHDTTFAAPASVTVSVTAADADGTVSKVDFYSDSTLLGSDSTSPYSFTWSNVPAGNYSLTAKATDNGSLITMSSAVNFSVYAPNVAPTVNITSPGNNATFTVASPINISAAATDADGSVSKVDFYRDSILLGSDNTSPYTFVWNNAPVGNYMLSTKAFDNSGSVTTSASISVSVIKLNAPTVRITDPVNNKNYSGPATINMTAVASDAGGKVTKVEFYNGSTLLLVEKYAPYNCTWSNVPAGNYILTAKAYDNSGNITVSPAILVTVNEAPVMGNAVQNVTGNAIVIASNELSIAVKNPEIAEAVSIKVGPNPASNTISVFTAGFQRNKQLIISVISISGAVQKMINTTTSNSVTQINISSLTNGAYFIKVVSGNTIIKKQFVKI